ncbi:MAG: hypothetical protein ACYSTL_07520 [Planctomycetota bacterium]|jgi:hypothetical protein
MKGHWALLVVLAGITGAMSAGGCELPKREDSLTEQLQTCKTELSKLETEAGELRTLTADQEKQIRTLRGLGEKRLEKLFYVERIELGRYTGAADLDGKAGDDGIKVFLKPIDRAGSVVKAAGDVKIQLFDLGIEPPDNLIGEYEWTPGQIAKQWSSGFVAYHFSFECPWKGSAPQHDEITVRVEFTDYLTGKTFTAQKLCKVKLAPKTAP